LNARPNSFYCCFICIGVRFKVRIHGRPRSDRKKRFLLSTVAPSTSYRHPREARRINWAQRGFCFKTTNETSTLISDGGPIPQAGVSRKFVSEICVSLVALRPFMRRSDFVTENTATGIGYTRVSTVSQTLDQQNAALEAAGVMKTFSDTMSAICLQTVKELTNRGVTVVSVTDGIDSSTPAGRMMIGVLGSLAEYELELTKERTPLKRQASRANGTKFGRPKKVADANHIATARRMKIDGHAARDIAKYLGVSRATLYRCLDESGAA
jgi:hypothetical protein